jgi:hypothetical protein
MCYFLIMKIIFLIIICGFLFIAGCSSPQVIPKPDIPRYTADQVLEVAQAAFPPDRIELHRCIISWNTHYTGKGIWEIWRIAIRITRESAEVQYLYFNETTGQISAGTKKTYQP